jgi:PAS domain S-box-containing protein
MSDTPAQPVRMSSPPRVWPPLLGVFGLASMALLIAWSGQWVAAREASFQTDSLRRAIDIHVLGLREAAARYSYLPEVVARQPDIVGVLQEPSRADLKARANQYLAAVNRRAGSEALYVMDAQGTTLAASNWNDPMGFVGESYANRPYFMDARNGRSGFFYGIGKTTGVPGLFLAAPVRLQGVVIGVVAVKVSLLPLASAWAASRDPIVLTDANGIVFLSSVNAWMFQSRNGLTEPALAWVRRHQQYGDRQTFVLLPWAEERSTERADYLIRAPLDGRPRQFLAVDEKLPEFGWTLTVMADYTPVAVARWLTWALGALGAAVLLLGGLYWRLRERRFAEQRDARRMLEVRVSERTRELQDAQAFRQAMEDSLLVGMRARDLQGRIIYVNQALCDMVGYSKEELMGRLPPYPYWHPDDLDKHWRDSDAALRGGAALTGFESRVRHRDGHDVDTMVYTAPLIDAAGAHQGWMSSVVDISAQKRVEELQRQHDAQLQHSGRLASLGEMASTLAHELNQPLMALSNFASAAKAFAEQGNQPLLVSSLEDIAAQAQRSGEIVRRIRGFVRQRTAGVEPCALNDVVANVLALLKPEIRHRDVRVATRLQPELPGISGDRVLLEQVLLNLVLNGVQAMQDMPAERRVVEIVTRQGDGVLQLQVSDQGPGIPPEVANHLFEPFFTTRAEGLGLGLNICRTIVESHGGRLSFRNQPDGGAVFTVELASTA